MTFSPALPPWGVLRGALHAHDEMCEIVMMGTRALRPAHALAAEMRHHVMESGQVLGMPAGSIDRHSIDWQSSRAFDRLRPRAWFGRAPTDAKRTRRTVPAPNKNPRVDSRSYPTLTVTTATTRHTPLKFWEHAQGRDPSKTQGDRDAFPSLGIVVPSVSANLAGELQ